MLQVMNPTSGQLIREYNEHTPGDIDTIIGQVHEAYDEWRGTSLEERSRAMRALGALLRDGLDSYASLITNEMGKPIQEARAEVTKCASACEEYAVLGPQYLIDQPVKTEAFNSYVTFEPLGVILGIMPWNFPFWQVFRCIAPTLMAGNGVLLKHSPNTTGCVLAIEELIRAAGFPKNLFRALLVQPEAIKKVIADDRVCAVTLTGSDRAGMDVASTAGKALKKTVLELGGSDPYIVLGDANVSKAVDVAVTARLMNAGQSCIAAKRFIVMRDVAEAFVQGLKEKVEALIVGDPIEERTQVGPLARLDLLEKLEGQVKRSLAQGAHLVCGGKRLERAGYFYLPTILTGVSRGMVAFDEEVFGPVFAMQTVDNEEQAISVANDTSFGLGASLWTNDVDKAKRLAKRLQAGSVFVNAMTVSHFRLPFGGVKRSGYGRELSQYGLHEFVNIKTNYISK